MRNFQDIKRVVIKIGTNILAPHGISDVNRIESLASDTARLKRRGLDPILVSSGAIGFGSQVLKIESRPLKIKMRQVAAAVGQPILMRHWQDALARHKVTAAQILLSRESFDDRKMFLNLKNAVENLLALGVVPVMNENDCVSTTEIGDVFGDNDSLSAHIASKLDAGLLVILTDIDALYDMNPKEHPQARPIHIVEKITEEIRAFAGAAGSPYATGGMVTKLQAVEIASRAGCRTVLADGRVPGHVLRILDGEELGTLFLPGTRMGARDRWILGARSKGEIRVDDGAMAAIEQRKSLLPSGIVGVDGTFSVGDIIRIGYRFKAITSMSSEEIKAMMGRHSRTVKSILGQGRREEVVRAEDIVPRE